MNKRLIGITTLALITTTAWGLAWQTTPATPAVPAKPATAATGAKPQAEVKKEDEEDEEEVIKLADAPTAVRDAVAKMTSPDKVTKVTKEEDDGVTVFEVEFTQDGMPASADFSKNGDVLEIEKSVKDSAMPAAVMAALKKKFPGGTFKSFTSVQKFSYEVEVVVDGKTHGVELNATGAMEDDESHEGANHERAGEKSGK
ncbi:MAG: hypothetical protein U0572_15750 [Phycisphaerales bacterium]